MKPALLAVLGAVILLLVIETRYAVYSERIRLEASSASPMVIPSFGREQLPLLLTATHPNALPGLPSRSPDVLAAGVTFNIEPAIYIDGIGGMRPLRRVAWTESGAEMLIDFSGRIAAGL